MTYHGPGQLVGYPIIDLKTWGAGPQKYVRTLEQVLIDSLADFEIVASNAGKPTGVWVNDAKIAAIGVRISRRVTMHGFALNVNPDISYFDHIVPCGLPGSRVTSMDNERPSSATVSDVMPVVARHFGDLFGLAVEWAELADVGLDVQLLSAD